MYVYSFNATAIKKFGIWKILFKRIFHFIWCQQILSISNINKIFHFSRKIKSKAFIYIVYHISDYIPLKTILKDISIYVYSFNKISIKHFVIWIILFRFISNFIWYQQILSVSNINEIFNLSRQIKSKSFIYIFHCISYYILLKTILRDIYISKDMRLFKIKIK